MADTRKIVRVFLASPGDLVEERIAIAGVASEINENWSDFLEYQIELMGWEDTVSRHGRPQEIINQELDRCELFIGMMWKKWGTPPDTDGKYTSGFHEEYDRAVARRDGSNVPEISMFFKKIPDQFLEDKGPDLIKVLDFKKSLIDDKAQLFQQFEGISDLTNIVRRCLTDYLVRLKRQENRERESIDSQKQEEKSPEEAGAKETEEVSSPFSPQGFRFLEELLGKVKNQESTSELTATDIARFRLLSNSIAKTNNDNTLNGVHDLNIIFANKERLDLGAVEKSNLARAGFGHLSNENVPLWYWYSEVNGEDYARVWSVLGDTDAERQGAILVLDRLGVGLPDEGAFNKKEIVYAWFAEGSADAVRTAAIDYLSNHGDAADIDHLCSEYERNDNQTSRKALEGMIRLSSRVSGAESAALLVISKQFDTIDERILDVPLSSFGELDTADLKTALDHRNAKVRLKALEELVDRGELAEDEHNALLEDGSAEIRFEALQYSIDSGDEISDEKARKILVRPIRGTGFGLLGRASQSDDEGERHFKKFKLHRLRQMGEKALSKKVASALIYDDLAYLALTEKYFAKWGMDLRANVDDQFAAYFDERVKRFQKLDTKGEHDKAVERMRSTEQTVRKELMRSAVDIICRKTQVTDLERVRRNVESDFVAGSVAEMDYMGRFGGWDDIEKLAVLRSESSVGGALAIFGDPEFYEAKAKTLYKLGRIDINKLMGTNIPAHIKTRILSLCSEAVFSGMEDGKLLELLNDESTQLRKKAALVAVRVFPVRRLKDLLKTYVSTAEYRYYNVIHWLDLGVSMPRSTAKSVAIVSE